MLGVVGEQRVREVDHLRDALVGDPVEHGAVLAPRLDEPAPAQAGEVVGDLRLRFAEPLDQFADRELALGPQQLEDPDPRGIAEAAEVLGDQVAASRRFRQLERSA